MAVRELMDDRYFFIPAYQRGYRWGKIQIYDLCSDLLDYALKKEQQVNNLIQNKSFYCLQPIISIPKLFKIKGKEINGYEVVDGQQRLSSLFILYRYLVGVDNNLSLLTCSSKEKDTLITNRYGTHLYHIFYETRPNDYDAFEKIGYEPLKRSEILDIDIAHISNAIQYIEEWYSDKQEGAPKVLARYQKKQVSKNDITRYLLDLLHSAKDSPKGSVQFIWYELDPQKDAIKEFIKENTGKIKLTDTELIKGLFLQKRNWEAPVRNLQQLSIGKDWEQIENTLHHNDFWSFLSNNIHQEDNRINIVFEYIYQKHNGGSALPKDNQNALFRFYSDYFESYGSMSKLWEEVKECFQAMQNWYEDPYIYNLVGLLSKHGKNLHDIISIYDNDTVKTTDDFLWKLKEEVLETLPKPETNDDLIFPNRHFHLFYGKDNGEIKNLLLFVNVHQLCMQLDEARKEIESSNRKSDQNRTEQDLMNHIYKFPYDVLDSFNWDIEHVDSATTNRLQGTDEKEEWLKGAEEFLKESILQDPNYHELKEKFQNEPNNKDANLNELIKQVKIVVGDDLEDEEEKKNWIGNLTLLDCGTNRGYGNALFAIKHEKIKSRIKEGIFVPICTQNVFDKVFSACTNGFWMWSWQDKLSYHDFLIQQYDDFCREIDAHRNDTNKGEVKEPIE
jgi:hypothetical protein